MISLNQYFIVFKYCFCQLSTAVLATVMGSNVAVVRYLYARGCIEMGPAFKWHIIMDIYTGER
jgi:hypothetical protein